MSELRANTVSNAAGTGPAALTKQRAAKSYSLLNQVAGTTLASFNTSSHTDAGAGTWSSALTSAMSSANYPISSSGFPDNYYVSTVCYSTSTTQVNIRCTIGGGYVDNSQITAVADGDLA